MSSPVYISFSQFIKIDRRKADPVYLQIVYQFIQAIQRGLLEDGNKVPGSRVLSKELKVHRKTVIAALEELQAQGWVEIKPHVGTFVKNPEHSTEKGKTATLTSPHSNFNFNKSYILDTAVQKNTCPYRFTDGEPDYRIIKNNELARFYSAALKRKSTIKRIPDFTLSGNSFFNEQLSYYINLTRGFHISKDNLIHAPSKEVLLYILTQLLIQTGDTVLVASFSYPFANMIFRQAGANLKTIPMDEEGITVDFIKNKYKRGDIRCIYISPQSQYPTTISLSENRRHALTALAEEYDFVIIEDDTDFELTYEKTSAIPLAKQDQNGRVLHLGAFGPFLTPGFQRSFMVAPTDFTVEARKYLNIFGENDLIKEQALGEMIREGDIHRYRRKALKLYRFRRDYFAALLETYFAKTITFRTPSAGLAFWLQFKTAVSLSDWAKKCEEKGLFLARICLYQNQTNTALRLGFGHLNEEEMKEAAEILRASYCGGVSREW